MSRTEDVAKFHSESVNQFVRGMANRLREVADEIERETLRVSLAADPDAPNVTHVQVASDVLHEITWRVANLHTETLITRAERADLAVRERAEARALELATAAGYDLGCSTGAAYAAQRIREADDAFDDHRMEEAAQIAEHAYDEDEVCTDPNCLPHKFLAEIRDQDDANTRPAGADQ